MSDIFISYASEDREAAKLLAGALESLGWSVWWDRTIPAGRSFSDVIDEALAEARCVLAIWSKIAVKKNWVLEEAQDGVDRGILVPAFIQDVRPPRGFRRIQAADLIGWDGTVTAAKFQKLVSDVALVLGPPPADKLQRQQMEVDEKHQAGDETRKLKKVEIETDRTHASKIDASPDSDRPASPISQAHADTRIKTALLSSDRPLLLWLLLAAYILFTVLLFNSTGTDREASYLFMGNAILLIVGSVISYFGKARTSRVCALGAIVQIAILVIMLALSIGDAGISIPLNLVIAAAFLGIMRAYVVQERKLSKIR